MTAKEKKLQIRKEYREYLNIADKRVLDIKKAGIELIDDKEIFVLVNETQNYWISNFGRLINNLRGYFYIHKHISSKKDGKSSVHFTLSYSEQGYRYTKDTFCDKLVAEHFLEQPKRCKRVWHIDKDCNNNYYKNLVWVNDGEYLDLVREVKTVEDLGRRQEYVPYITLKSNIAYSIWNGIYNRCYKPDRSTYGRCYDEATMCDSWLNNRDTFVEWFLSNYYNCDNESMAVDKDLLVPGNKHYSPETCCILPQTLNTMLSNCKKHRPRKWTTGNSDLPLGVRYDEYKQVYYGQIKPCVHDEVLNLSYWETPEQAFEEYKRFKQADILMMAAKYKSKIPRHVYEALIKYDVKPYVED